MNARTAYANPGSAGDATQENEVNNAIPSYPNSVFQDEPRTVVVNGLRVQMRSGSTSNPLGIVTKHFSDRCIHAVDEHFFQTDETSISTARLLYSLFRDRLFFKKVTKNHAVISCFLPHPDFSISRWLKSAFFYSPKIPYLNQIGHIEWIYISRRPRLNPQLTHYVALWSTPNMRVQDLLHQRTKPGHNMPTLGSHRSTRVTHKLLLPLPDGEVLFSLFEPDYAVDVWIYGQFSMKLESLLQAYARKILDAKGKWTSIGNVRTSRVFTYQLRNTLGTISADQSVSSNQFTITIVQQYLSQR